MSSRRAKIRSPKKYGTTCAIEAHHDYTATKVLRAALPYISSFVSFPLPAALGRMFPTTHKYVVAMQRESSSPGSRRLVSLMTLLSDRANVYVVYDRSHMLLVQAGTTSLQRTGPLVNSRQKTPGAGLRPFQTPQSLTGVRNLSSNLHSLVQTRSAGRSGL